MLCLAVAACASPVPEAEPEADPLLLYSGLPAYTTLAHAPISYTVKTIKAPAATLPLTYCE